MKVDWKNFPWDKYKAESKAMLTRLCRNWKQKRSSTEDANNELTTGIMELINKLAPMKRICHYSRSWIGKKCSLMLKKLCAARKRMQLHKGHRNVKMYRVTQEETLKVIDQAYEE